MTGRPPAAVIAVAAWGAGVVALRRRRRADRRRLRNAQVPVVLERLAGRLRAGSSLPTALAEIGAGMPAPLGPEITGLGHQAEGGRATVDVLDAWARAHDDAGTRLASTALVLAATVGAAPARAADGVATTLRERADLAAERRALAAQVRLSAAVLSVAPVAFACLLGATDGAAADFLLGTPAGWACMITGVGLDGAGAWWMARLTRGGDL